MAPKPASASLLFHPKKDTKKDIKRELSERPSTSPRKTQSGTPAKAEPEDDIQLPQGAFQEFRLMSSALNGWKYDVMKFDSRKPVDISSWQTPIKLNRKELRREDSAGNSAPEAVGPMLGADGKPVIGMDGKVVMVDIEGRPIQPSDGISGGKGFGEVKGKGAGNAKKKFQKKTRQVYLVPEATRQLRREERYPWVIEDASQSELWVGKLEEVSKSETHAFFMPAANDVFKFVPAHRWYKFQKKPHYHVPSLEEAESMMAKHQKNKDPERWLLHNRGKAASSATSAIFKAESEGRSLSGGSSLVHNASQSLGPGGRKLKTVESGGDGLFGDDDDDVDTKRRKDRELGGEGDIDEQVYDEDFADDDDKVEEDQDDEETKELEERLKREYKSANKQREGYVDESDDDGDQDELTRDGKAMKKLIRNLEKNHAYESDEDKNPYASSDEEEEPEPPVVTNEPSIQQQPQQVPSPSGSQTPSASTPPAPRPQPLPDSNTRVTSPTPAPGLGGHSMFAKRATSPKPPKPKVGNASHGASAPRVSQGSSGSRAASPSRGTSPAAPSLGGSRAGSPVAQNPSNPTAKPTNKRKATDDSVGPSSPNGSTAPMKSKKRKAGGSNAPGAVPAGELEDRMVIEWLRSTPNASTRDCIQHFTPYLTDEAKKSKFTALVKEVAQLKGGVLVLRNAYRGVGSSAPSPAPILA